MSEALSSAASAATATTPWWRRPIVLSVLVVLLTVAGTIGWSMYVGGQDEPGQGLAHGLPWQIETTPDGGSMVFGLQPGVDTLASVQSRLGEDLTLGLIVAGDTPPALEGFVESLRAGFITGRLVAAFEADDGWLQRARERAVSSDFGEGGRSRRYTLSADDRHQAGSARLLALAYLPAAKLDAETVRQRFGEPAERITGPQGESQWLYPDRGVAVMLPPQEGAAAKARAVIQYVAPRDFEARLRAPLQAASAPR
jgi:hypothetical protein